MLDRFKRKIVFVLFLGYLLIQGIIFSFIIPPFQKPDEFAHFKRMVSIVKFDFSCQNKFQLIPKKFYEVIDNVQINELRFKYNSKMPVSLYKSNVAKGEVKYDISEGCRFKNWVGYLISIFYYKILTPLPLNGFILLGLIRFFTFLTVYVILIFYVLKIKDLFIRILIFFVLGLPMTLNQTTAVSYDVGHLFFGMFFLILFFRLKEEKEYTFSKLFFLIIIFLGFIFSKPLYEFFFLLFFLLEEKKFKNLFFKKNQLIFFFILPILIFKFLTINQTGKYLGNFDPRIQATILLSDPLRLIQIIEKTYFESITFYLKSIIGILGWLDFDLNFFLYFFFYGLMGFLIGFFVKKNKISPKEFLIYFLLLFLNIGYIFLGEFLYWTEPGASSVSGVQGRYFLIFIPFFFLILNFILQRMFFFLTFFLLIFITFLNIKTIFKRYYDYSVYARLTLDLNSFKKAFIQIPPGGEKLIRLEEPVFGNCYSVLLRFKGNKFFKEPIKVEVYDKSNREVVYFIPSRVNYSEEATGIDFARKIKFNPPVFVKILNPYGKKSVTLLDKVALNCY